MTKRHSYFLALAVLALALGLAAAFSPVSPSDALAALTARPIHEGRAAPAPRRAAKALRLVRVDVQKLALDFEHKRYRGVCADLTAKERRQLGGTSTCMLKVDLLNSLAPVKRFTVVKAKLSRRRTLATVAFTLNGGSHVLRAVFRWEAGRYRLDHQLGSIPGL